MEINKSNFNYRPPNQPTPVNIGNKETPGIPPVKRAGETGDKPKEGEREAQREQQAQETLLKLAELNARSSQQTGQQTGIDNIRKIIADHTTPPNPELPKNLKVSQLSNGRIRA